MPLLKSFIASSRSLVVLGVMLLAARGPKDADIESDVDAALVATPGVTASVASGVVTLAGQAADSATRSVAEANVTAVKGVKSVVNSATVLPPPPPPVVMSPDDSLLTNVGVALQEFPTLSALNPKKIDNKAKVTR